MSKPTRWQVAQSYLGKGLLFWSAVFCLGIVGHQAIQTSDAYAALALLGLLVGACLYLPVRRIAP